MPKASKTHLLQVIVSGALNYTIQSYYDGSPLPDPLPVVVGDHVGFFVQVKLQFGRLTPSYEIVFKDPNFFGVPSITVPGGGVSPFVQVRSVLGRVSYSLIVSGIGLVFDPEIQSGSDGPGSVRPHPEPDEDDAEKTGSETLVPSRHFTATWDLKRNTISYVTDGIPGRWPMPVSYQDSVTFIATNATETPTDFMINFLANNGSWGSPFSVDGSSLPGLPLPTGLSTGAVPVQDNIDTKPISFPIIASITMATGQQQSTNDPSYIITMN